MTEREDLPQAGHTSKHSLVDLRRKNDEGIFGRIVVYRGGRDISKAIQAGDCEHPIAVANASKFLKLGWGAAETFSPESKMAARNGGTTDEFRRVMASEMDMPPADWPCERKSWPRMMAAY